MSFYDFVVGRIEFAERLYRSEGAYGEAALVLSALLSGLASRTWPGKGKDLRRFVEAWSTLSAPSLNASLISVPLLLDALDDAGELARAEKVRAARPNVFAPGNEDMVLTGDRVDMAEGELLALDPGLVSKELRRFSYGRVFYEHVRSGYVHEYRTTESARPCPQTGRPAPISYVNTIKYPEARIRRPIHFDIVGVGDVVRSVAITLTADGPVEARPVPGTWWIDGQAQ